MEYLNSLIKWSNTNAGFISVVVFISTILVGWVSGIFRSLIKKPQFKIRILEGPTICSTFTLGRKHKKHDIHRTAISIYMGLANVGSAPANIEKIWVGYHWHLKPVSWLWFRYKFFWFWLKDPITTMDDFQYDFGEQVKIYPSLLQGTYATGHKPETYLEVGKSVNGVVYFEQDDSWGGCFPTMKNSKVKLRVVVLDTFGRKYKKTFWVPFVTLEEAQKYNPSFGATFATLRGEINSENNA